MVGNTDPFAAIIMAAIGLGAFFALRSIELGIGLQTRTIVDRGSVIEVRLAITGGIFTALQGRLNSPISQRITYIIRVGYVLGIGASALFMSMGFWAATR